MRVLDAGHRYELQGNKGGGPTVLQFFKDARLHDGDGAEGTTNQEVARALIDRLRYLEAEAPWGGDFHMIDNLRDLIVMHEVRAAMRRGLCGAAAMRVLVALNRAELPSVGIERIQPRSADGHIYPRDIHRAADCDGKCERLDA